jgi:L-2-hydroxyglutarate oxidase LhgO
LDQPHDVCVIGGGLVGLATALAILRLPSRPARLAILEAEPAVAQHQSGHNSGVIHSSLYYKPGSLKAKLCAAGRAAMEHFCSSHAIPFERCGKLVIATTDAEIPRLQELQRRGQANGLENLRWLQREQIAEHEPYATGVAALHVPATGIVDYRRVAQAMAADIRDLGGDLRFGSRVLSATRVSNLWRLTTASGDILARIVINCAGLHSDRVARLLGHAPSVRIVPFRGEYHELTLTGRRFVRNLIYPVPDPALPFLGVHFTRRIDSSIEAGPNAVLALARRGYRWSAISPRESAALLADPAVWKLCRRFWRVGVMEVRRSLSRKRLVADLRRLVPAIQPDHLVPAHAGVRAQAVDNDGRLVDDFRIELGEGAMHVLNAPSPGATASLAIGEFLAERLATEFPLRPQTTVATLR